MRFINAQSMSTVSAKTITVEVAYARVDVQVILPVEVAEGATVAEALRLSGILEDFPEIDLAVQKIGVFGKLVNGTQTLRAGDRVEIYRPLVADPKEARKRRAADSKKLNK